MIARALLSIAKLYEGWTYTVEQGTYNEQLLMKSWLKYDKIMLAGSIPRAKRRKKLIIRVITTCGSTCTHSHDVSWNLPSVHNRSHSNRMGLSIRRYASCEHVLHRQLLWHTQMCTPCSDSNAQSFSHCSLIEPCLLHDAWSGLASLL